QFFRLVPLTSAKPGAAVSAATPLALSPTPSARPVRPTAIDSFGREVFPGSRRGKRSRANGMRLCGMGGQRLYAAIERKRGAVPCPRPSGIRTVPHTPASRTQTYAVIRCHTLPPFVSAPASSRKRKNIVLCLTLPQQMDLALRARHEID